MSPKPADIAMVPMPPAGRGHPEVRFPIDRSIITLFALSNMFSMNLYFCQSLLVELSNEFGVDHQGIARIPTLVQAGCAAGLLLLMPLAQTVPRRLLLLVVFLLSILSTIGLAITTSFLMFQLFSFLVGASSFIPQILVPMTAEFSEPQKRPLAILSVFSGVLLGPPLARAFAGAVAYHSNFRNVYWMAAGGQYVIWTLLYFYCPDTSKREHTTGTYSEALRSTVNLAFAEPILIQSCLISVASSATFSSSWAILPFLLDGTPHNRDALAIGAFGLIGLSGVYSALFVGRHIEKLLPAMVTILSTIGIVISQTIQLSFGGDSIVTIAFVTACLDIAWHAQQVSLAASVYGISTEAKARLHTILLISLCLGQAAGTSIGVKIFTLYGWRGAALLNLAWAAWQLLAFLL